MLSDPRPTTQENALRSLDDAPFNDEHKNAMRVRTQHAGYYGNEQEIPPSCLRSKSGITSKAGGARTYRSLELS